MGARHLKNSFITPRARSQLTAAAVATAAVAAKQRISRKAP